MSILLFHELSAARDRIFQLKRHLLEAKTKELAFYQGFLDEIIDFLDNTLEQTQIQERYSVAVVGRFKVGKSDFVNKLLGEQLAGVHSNPETAAISFFRYADTARAEVEFISSEEWEKLKSDHESTPQNPELMRYDKFINFNKHRISIDKINGKNISSIDLQALTACWLKPGGYIHTITSEKWETKEGKNEFTKKIKKFTSSKEPLHYLVNKLTIYAPIPLLQDSIELIDTPGLEDTEKLRVQLANEVVKDVDAILFLTKGGESYSQSDKNFIVQQLRRKKIKHIQIIITQGDLAFDKSIKDADENGEESPSYEDVRDREINRVKYEIETTLNELLSLNNIAENDKYYFIEQLDDIPIYLISTTYHKTDISKGGIEAVRKDLYRILSTSQRIKQAQYILSNHLEVTLKRLKNSYHERLEAIENDYDPQKVKDEIKAIQCAVEGELNFLSEKSEEFVGLLKNKQSMFQNSLAIHLELIDLKAREVLGDIEKVDLSKHWRTSRSGRWGYLDALQEKVANSIFPKVELILNELRGQTKEFMEQIENCLDGLQHNIRKIEDEHSISGLGSLSLVNSQQQFFKSFEHILYSFTMNQRDAIMSQLDKFVDKEISQRLDQSRSEVTSILGTGTTWRQNSKVTQFYKEIKNLLGKALHTHLTDRIEEFKKSIVNSAESVVPQLRQASKDLIDQRLQAIESSLEIKTSIEKDKVQNYIYDMTSILNNFYMENRINIHNTSSEIISDPTNSILNIITKDKIINDNKNKYYSEQHYTITEGSTGYTYERIFRPYIDDAEKIIIEDPYIRTNHQFENFVRFCTLVLDIGIAKHIFLKSGYKDGEDLSITDKRLEQLVNDLKDRNVEFCYSRDQNIHARKIYLSNGWTIKVDRGLDIYLPPESELTKGDYSLRPCQRVDVDIFRSTE